MSITGFEIDFLPVGSGPKNGDAILVRYSNFAVVKRSINS